MDSADPPEFRTEISLADAEATEDLAISLAPKLQAGDVLLIEGPIGAGKSHFCRSVIQNRLAALGRAEDVPSPTYTLVQVYDLEGLEIWHADLYRLTSPDDVFELGLNDAFDHAVCLVEWPDRLGAAAPEGALKLHLMPGLDPDSRTAILSAHNARWASVISGLAAGGNGPT